MRGTAAALSAKGRMREEDVPYHGAAREKVLDCPHDNAGITLFTLQMQSALEMPSQP